MVIFRWIFMAIGAFGAAMIIKALTDNFEASIGGWLLVCGIISYVEFRDK